MLPTFRCRTARRICLEITLADLLEVQDLKTQFHTREGLVYAVNGVSYTMDEGETLGIVGASGCGKSVYSQWGG